VAGITADGVGQIKQVHGGLHQRDFGDHRQRGGPHGGVGDHDVFRTGLPRLRIGNRLLGEAVSARVCKLVR
jgi:hypothetical protein